MELQCFFIVTVLWIFSVCLHEFGHAWVAYRGGDFTVAAKGYLTMNPLRYTHPLYSLLMPLVFMALGGIGLPGGAVYIDRSLLRSRAWETAVSLAGPAMNVLLIVLLGAAFRTGLVPPDSSNLATISLAFLLRLQVYALILNLLPVPPLDGFQAIAPWLPDDVRERLYGFANTGLFLVFLVLWFVPPVAEAFSAMVTAVCDVAGVERRWAALGYRAFRFWE
jgi:Zn-dependent protease